MRGRCDAHLFSVGPSSSVIPWSYMWGSPPKPGHGTFNIATLPSVPYKTHSLRLSVEAQALILKACVFWRIKKTSSASTLILKEIITWHRMPAMISVCLDSLLLGPYVGQHMVHMCVLRFTYESRNSCAGNEGDGRRLSGEKEGKRRLVKVSPRGSESTIDTDSGVFSL